MTMLLLASVPALHEAKEMDLDSLGDLSDLFASFGGALGDLGDSAGMAVDPKGKGKRKGRGRQKKKRNKEFCDAGKFKAPVSLNSLLQQQPRRQFTANGCGPEGMEVKEPFGLWRCCNGHDVCYSTPTADFPFCESTFTSCMKKVCNELEADDSANSVKCHKQADGFAGMTKMFGRGSHSSSQRETVECVDSIETAHERWTTFVQEIYDASDVVMDREQIERNLAKYKGKEGTLAYKLVLKYGQAFVKKTGSVDVEFYHAPKKNVPALAADEKKNEVDTKEKEL
jgi:secretory phospholipase A2